MRKIPTFLAGILCLAPIRATPETFERQVELIRQDIPAAAENGARAEVSFEIPQIRPNVNAGSSSGIEWVSLAAGSFMMGSDSGYPDWKPVHRVTILSGFQMAKSAVTVTQYAACVAAGVCTTPQTGDFCNWGVSGRENHPVNCVDWEQARTFSQWVGGRLPTEAEREYAARGGGRSVVYPWGDQPPTCDVTVMSDCSPYSTTPVCSKPAGNTPQGLCDMAGNVYEWVEDAYHLSYEGAPADGGAWKTGGYDRVLRGYSWGGDIPMFMRVANRFHADPAAGHVGNVGFRLVRPLR